MSIRSPTRRTYPADDPVFDRRVCPTCRCWRPPDLTMSRQKGQLDQLGEPLCAFLVRVARCATQIAQQDRLRNVTRLFLPRHTVTELPSEWKCLGGRSNPSPSTELHKVLHILCQVCFHWRFMITSLCSGPKPTRGTTAERSLHWPLDELRHGSPTNPAA